jgi:cephalosporin hydroxylase
LDGVSDCFWNAQQAGLDAQLLLQNILESDIQETELLLVDSHHTYDQVREEMNHHAYKVSKYIIFHDITLYGLSGQDPGSVGIWPAINEFKDANPEWKVHSQWDNNNGLLVLKKD